jgi:hypothetical protein
MCGDDLTDSQYEKVQDEVIRRVCEKTLASLKNKV